MLGSGNESQLSVTSVIMGEAAHTLQCAVLFICGALQVTCVTCTFEYNNFQLNDELIRTNHSKVWFPISLNYIKLTFPPQWQKLEHGVCFAKLITNEDLTLESWNTFYKGGAFIHSHGFKHACLLLRSASVFKSRQETHNDYLLCDWALKSCALMSESAAMFTPLQKSNFQMFTLFST